MDLNFARFERLLREAKPAPLDHRSLIATLAGLQAGSATARVQATLADESVCNGDTVEALVTLFQGRAGWADAAASLHGSFHPATARRETANRPSTKMTAAFTLPG